MMGKTKRGRSPAMQQFFRAKQQYPEAILFFRMGDFYEMFFEDAERVARLLDIALTTRGKDEHGQDIPMAGVPHHSAASYIARLLAQGERVAVCEQMADPATVKGVVPREVVRVVTPGLVLDSDALDAREHNYLAAVVAEDDAIGMACFELSTGELRACSVRDRADLVAELARLEPREILLSGSLQDARGLLAAALPRAAVRLIEAETRGTEALDERLEGMLDEALGREPAHRMGAPGVRAAREALAYAQRAQPGTALNLQRIGTYDSAAQLVLDDVAVRNLELLRTLRGERKGSLLHLLDETRTPMGARLLRSRVLAPLTDVRAIRRRHDAVEYLVSEAGLRGELRELLGRVSDLERLSTRAALGVATPHELGATRRSLRACRAVAEALRAQPRRGTVVDEDVIAAPEDACEDVHDRLQRALVDELPATGLEHIIREGFDARIDELRALSSSSKDVILELEQKERQRTGIGSLKVRYTKVFGYYIEVTRANLGAVPADYRRKQTVANGERYTTEALDELQAKIEHAEDRLRALEHEAFEQLRREVGEQAGRLGRLAASVADLDVHATWAELAHRYDYVRPTVDDGLALELRDCRHPIIERTVERGTFVPNDVVLDVDAARLMIITGPNMAGKSTVMRQAALAVIMAQAGGFVPAQSGRVGVCDRIYTRVGASDNVSEGESTFMVEMRETATILHRATRRSLVILDELGRGTSTYDGLAIAWAVAEHLHDAIGCRAMFATHYHELCELSATRAGVENRNVAAKEHEGRVVFLHRLLAGGANRSYGVAVAKLAGVSEIVLARARALLHELEAGQALPSGEHASPRGREGQLDLFAGASQPAESEVETTLRALDVDRMAPVDALVALARLKALLP